MLQEEGAPGPTGGPDLIIPVHPHPAPSSSTPSKLQENLLDCYPGRDRLGTPLTSGQGHDQRASWGGRGQVKGPSGRAVSRFPFQLVPTNP